MEKPTITSSPFGYLADLFLDTFGSGAEGLNLDASNSARDSAFSNILDKTINQTREAMSGWKKDTFEIGRSAEPKVRKSALDELDDQLSAVGLPADKLSLDKEDLGRIKKVLQDSDLSEEEISGVMEDLSQGPLTLDRVMAVLSSAKGGQQGGLKVGENTKPLLSIFLQDMGMNSDQIKDILSSLKPGQDVDAELLKKLMLRHGDKNLRGPVMAQADQKNLRDLLVSMGVGEKDMQNLINRMNDTGGKISLEGFLGFLKSVDRPETLSRSQMDNIRSIVDNLKLNGGIKPNLMFSRIVSLLSVMGDRDLDQNFMSDNPAVQALRGGAMTARSLSEGAGIMGRSGSGGGQGGLSENGQGAAGSDYKTLGPAGSTRPTEAGLPSRLSRSVMAQIAEKMVYQSKNGQHSLRLQLNPQDLGKVSINLVMRNGGLHANLVAENPQVKEALESQAAALKQSLAQQGLELAHFDVSLSQDNQNRHERWARRKKFSLNLFAPETEAIDPEIGSAQARIEQDQNGRLNLVA